MKNNLKVIGLIVFFIVCFIPSLIVAIIWNIIDTIVEFSYDYKQMAISNVKSEKTSSQRLGDVKNAN